MVHTIDPCELKPRQTEIRGTGGGSLERQRGQGSARLVMFYDDASSSWLNDRRTGAPKSSRGALAPTGVQGKSRLSTEYHCGEIQ